MQTGQTGGNREQGPFGRQSLLVWGEKRDSVEKGHLKTVSRGGWEGGKR